MGIRQHIRAIGPAWVLCMASLAAPADTPLDTTFTYQGQLKQSGSPEKDTADFQFTLWDAAADGNQIGPVAAIDNVTLINGVFTVPLDFGAAAFDGNARWLEIAVRSPEGSGALTVLSPRQPIAATPYALHVAGPWLTRPDGSISYTGGNVGIGTANPESKLDVRGPVFVQGEGTILHLLMKEFSSFAPFSRPNLGFYRARGTIAAPLTVMPGDHVWSIEGVAYNSGNPVSPFNYVGGIAMTVDSVTPAPFNPAISVVESSLHFDTASAEAGSGRTVMTINKDGNVGIGTANPGAKLHIAGTPGVDGIRFPDGTVQTTAADALPFGAIVMWSGTLATIPQGWALCDGTSGTPDLRDRFVLGISAGENPGATGGSVTHSHTVSSHTHTVDPPSSFTSLIFGFFGDSGPGPATAAHQHTVDIPAFQSGSSTATTDSADHRPPYFKLAYIIKM